MRGMRQASNRAAKTAISFQCWVQESERGTSASWTAFISTGSTLYIYNKPTKTIVTNSNGKGLIPCWSFGVSFFFPAPWITLFTTLCKVSTPILSAATLYWMNMENIQGISPLHHIYIYYVLLYTLLIIIPYEWTSLSFSLVCFERGIKPYFQHHPWTRGLSQVQTLLSQCCVPRRFHIIDAPLQRQTIVEQRSLFYFLSLSNPIDNTDPNWS